MFGKTLTYIALLRGINVSGHNMIKMAELKQLFAELGFLDIQTYLQSGNIVFKADKSTIDKIGSKIETEILSRFGLTIPVIVLEKDTLNSIRNCCPFSTGNIDQFAVYITFPSGKTDIQALTELDFPKAAGEEVVFTENAVYLYLPGGYGTTKLNNNFFEKKLKITATTRNWKTVNELLILAGQTEK
jgi:uncharacterized protein (DUF1697 family)